MNKLTSLLTYFLLMSAMVVAGATPTLDILLQGDFGTTIPVTNGDFSDAVPPDTWTGSAEVELSGWSNHGTHDAGRHASITAGVCTLEVTGALAGYGIYKPGILEIGKQYILSIDLTSGLHLAIGSTQGGFDIDNDLTDIGVTTYNFTAVGTDLCISNSVGVMVAGFTDVTLREAILGPELVVNGDFETANPPATDWTLAAGVTVDGITGTADIDVPSTVNVLTQGGILTVGETYLISFSLSNYASGDFRIDNTFDDFTAYNANGRYSVIANAYIGANLQLTASGASEFSVDNVSVRKVLSPWIPSNDTDISNGDAQFTASTDTDQTILQQDTVALVAGATYKVYIDVSGVVLDDPAAYVGIQLGAGGIYSLTEDVAFGQSNPLYLKCGGTVTEGLQISSVNTTAGDTMTLDNISVIVEHFKPGTNTTSLFVTADMQVPDGGGGIEPGPMDEYIDSTSTLNGEIVYVSTNNHPNGSGGSAPYRLWYNGSTWMISRTPGVSDGPSWLSSGGLISSYNPFTSAPQSIGDSAVTYGPTDHSTAIGSAGLETDGIAGYIDLKTNYDYLNGLMSGKFGIVEVFEFISGNSAFRVISAESVASVGYRIQQSTDKSFHIWDGSNQIDINSGVETTSVLQNSLLSLEGTTSRAYFNDALAGSDGYSGLSDTNPTIFRLGGRTEGSLIPTNAKFGFISLLDYTNVTDTIDEPWSTGLSEAINAAAEASDYDPHAIALAIYNYDNNITGYYYALNELSSGDASNYYLLAYDIATQTAQTSEFYGLTSVSGVTGTVLVEAVTDGGNSTFGPWRSVFGPKSSVFSNN